MWEGPVHKIGCPPRAGVLGWACNARAAGGAAQGNSILGLSWAELCPCITVWGSRDTECSWGCPSSPHPHDKAWSLPGTGFGPVSSREKDLGSPGVPFSKPPLPTWSWSRHVLPPSCLLARKLQTLLVPNDRHLPLLGFAAPLYLRQLVVGLCCWLLSAGVSALDQVKARSGQRLGTSRVGWPHPDLFSASLH